MEEEDRFFSPSATNEFQSREWEMVNGSNNSSNINTNNNNDGEEEVFPPSHHEGLHLHPREQHQEDESRLTQIKLFDDNEEAQPQREPIISRLRDVVKMKLKLGFEIISSKICYILNLVRSRGGIRSFGSVAGVTVAMVVSLWYLKWKRWKKLRAGEDKIDRLMVLVRCQDEKISQLLNQISYLNDLLSARRSIPVLKSG